MGYFYTDFPVLNPFRSKVPKGFYDPIKGHSGTDYGTPKKTPLFLPISAKVELIAKQDQMGLTLYMSDPDDNVLVFAHLSKVDLKIGDEVPAGSVIALSGNSGTATTAPHVHFEIIAQTPTPGFEVMTRSLQGFSGYNIDPSKYLDDKQKPAHWSDEAMAWMVEHELIGHKHSHSASVSWGELSVVCQRLAKKIIEWTNS